MLMKKNDSIYNASDERSPKLSSDSLRTNYQKYTLDRIEDQIAEETNESDSKESPPRIHEKENEGHISFKSIQRESRIDSVINSRSQPLDMNCHAAIEQDQE
jgi:hypothetical protein